MELIMYKSKMQEQIISALIAILNTKFSKGEDNFRQILGFRLKEYYGDNCYIPPTTDGIGDIVIFDRNIEIKYYHTTKKYNEYNDRKDVNEFLKDFDCLLNRQVDFFLATFCINKNYSDQFIANFLKYSLPKNVTDIVHQTEFEVEAIKQKLNYKKLIKERDKAKSKFDNNSNDHALKKYMKMHKKMLKM